MLLLLLLQCAGKLESPTGARSPINLGHLALRIRGYVHAAEGGGPGNLVHLGLGNLPRLASLAQARGGEEGTSNLDSLAFASPQKCRITKIDYSY